MKKVLLLSIILISISAKCQVVLDHITFRNFIAYDKGGCYFSVEKDSVFTINDSLKTIKELYKLVLRNQKEIEELSISLNKSVEWSNTVSDYFKKNKKFKLYIEAIKKQGYKSSKRK